MTDAHIEQRVINKFKELEGLTIDDDGNYPEVAFPYQSFSRPADGYWYELFYIPSEPIQIELGEEARSRWVGILQVNVVVPKESGMEPALARFDSIAKLFRAGSYIDNIRVNRTYRSSAYEDGDFYVLPVSVEVWADLDR